VLILFSIGFRPNDPSMHSFSADLAKVGGVFRNPINSVIAMRNAIQRPRVPASAKDVGQCVRLAGGRYSGMQPNTTASARMQAEIF
jgi:hypothetical protein